jgi:hypothetical protein
VNDFKAGMFTREEADYRAEKLLEIAKEFNKRMKKFIG